MVFFISKSINVLLATYQGAIFIDCNTARLCPCCRMNPASRRRLIRSRIRISDLEDTRRGESFNERCPNGRISLFNSRGLHEAGDSAGTSVRRGRRIVSGMTNKAIQTAGQYMMLGAALMNPVKTVPDVVD